MFKRSIATLLGLLLAIFVTITPTLAANGPTGNLHFCTDVPTTFTVNPDGSLTSTGAVCGAGVSDITAQLAATVAVTCSNPGRNEDVQGQRQTITSQAVAIHPENGRAAFDLTTGAPANTKGTCPNPQWTPHFTITSATLSFYQSGVLVLQQSFSV